MQINEEEKEHIINFGAFNYKPELMANILNKSLEEIELNFEDEDSEFYKLYKKGFDMSEYTIDLKLFNLAQTGDLKALEKLEQRIENRG